MNHHHRAAGLVAVLLTAGSALAQQDFSKVEIKTTHVAGKVYMLEGRGGNIGVSVGDDGVMMIDDQYRPLAGKIKAAIEKLGGGAPKYILNTHYHGDHTGGNPEFGEDGTIIAHKNVRVRVSTPQTIFGRTVEPLPKEGWPVITFEEGLSIHFNGEEVRIHHLPAGHTDGDSVAYFTKSNVLHMGDHVFMGMFPFVDLEHGGDVEGMARNVKKMLGMIPADAKIIPGHGPLCSVDDVKTYHRMLVETTERVRKGMKAGKDLDALKAAGVPDEWKPWGNGFIQTDRWVETVYASLNR